jgi:hypothetical protein
MLSAMYRAKLRERLEQAERPELLPMRRQLRHRWRPHSPRVPDNGSAGRCGDGRRFLQANSTEPEGQVVLDRARLQERLEQTERNVSEAEWHINCARELVRQLQGGGRDLRLATNMLRQFERRLATYIGERDRLRKELGL